MAKVKVKLHKESEIESIGFNIDTKIITISQDDIFKIQGVLHRSNGNVETCMVYITKLDWLFLQSKFFDKKKQNCSTEQNVFRECIGIVLTKQFEYAGIDHIYDFNDDLDIELFQRIEDFNEKEIEELSMSHSLEVMAFKALKCELETTVKEFEFEEK